MIISITVKYDLVSITTLKLLPESLDLQINVRSLISGITVRLYFLLIVKLRFNECCHRCSYKFQRENKTFGQKTWVC